MRSIGEGRARVSSRRNYVTPDLPASVRSDYATPFGVAAPSASARYAPVHQDALASSETLVSCGCACGRRKSTLARFLSNKMKEMKGGHCLTSHYLSCSMCRQVHQNPPWSAMPTLVPGIFLPDLLLYPERQSKDKLLHDVEWYKISGPTFRRYLDNHLGYRSSRIYITIEHLIFL